MAGAGPRCARVRQGPRAVLERRLAASLHRECRRIARVSGAKHPVEISRTLPSPSCASSPRVRSASRSEEASGRATRTRVVCSASRSAALVAAYSSFCASSPASGPRHDVPPTLVSMKSDHAAGSSSRRSVCRSGRRRRRRSRRLGRGLVPQQPGELVEGGDLHGAGSGELLLDARHRSLRQYAAIGADDAFAVVPGGRLRIDVESRQARHGRDALRRSGELDANTSSRFEAGSVLTRSTRLPASASAMAVAQAVDVLPAPPLPVKRGSASGGGSLRRPGC